MADFPTLPCLRSPLGGTPYNFWMKLTSQKLEAGVWKNFIILTSTVFIGLNRVTDGQTDGR